MKKLFSLFQIVAIAFLGFIGQYVGASQHNSGAPIRNANIFRPIIPDTNAARAQIAATVQRENLQNMPRFHTQDLLLVGLSGASLYYFYRAAKGFYQQHKEKQARKNLAQPVVQESLLPSKEPLTPEERAKEYADVIFELGTIKTALQCGVSHEEAREIFNQLILMHKNKVQLAANPLVRARL